MKNFELIEQLFHLARELPADQQEAFLLSKTQEKSLIDDVISLLKAQNSGTFSNAVRQAAENLYDSAEDTFIGQAINNYQIIEKIGAGGMGSVYKAKRNDGIFEKEYAIKIVKKGMDTDEIVSRFNLERELLARLSHPAIAAVIDGGATEDGRPYFVMEYVDGVSITDYCNKNKLSISKRISLFVEVCDAVHYAHKNLIIHRDLKPSNILVTPDGNPKLLDFGIGKLIGGPNDQALTMTNMRLYTPAYAAPEQITHPKNASTSLDVYALGVILFELLIGQRPFDDEQTELINTTLNARTIPKPSHLLLQKHIKQAQQAKELPNIDLISQQRNTNTSALVAKLKGDIDIICLKAMHNDPEMRYSSVVLFADDLQRYLNLMPIHARPDSFKYRLSKMFARNKQSFVATGLAILVLVSTISYYTYELKRERDRAQLEQARTQEVVNFVTRLFRNADPGQGNRPNITAREVLEKGAQEIVTELADRPVILSQLSTVLGEIFQELGENEQAAIYMHQVLTINKNSSEKRVPDLIAANLILSFIEQESGRSEDAKKYLDDAAALVRERFGESSIEHHEIMLAKADWLQYAGEPEKASLVLKEALDVIVNIDDERQPLRYAKNLTDYGGGLRFLDKNEEAETVLRQALKIQQSIYDFEHLEILSTKLKLAASLGDLGKYDESASLFLEVIEGRTALLGSEHMEVLHAWNDYSQVLSDQGNTEAAIEAIQSAINIAIKTGNFNVTTLGAMYHNLSIYQRDTEQYEDAIESAKNSIKSQNEAGLNDKHRHRYYPLYEIGKNHMSLKQWELAETWFEETLAILHHNHEATYRRILTVRSDLAFVILKQDRFAEAEKHLLEIIPPAIDYYGIERHLVQYMIERLMWVYEKTGDAQRAQQYRDMLTAEYIEMYY